MASKPETLFVEILDENNKAVPNGQCIVITSLYNKAHPFIRYDIGDTGILDEAAHENAQKTPTTLSRANK
jgi:phenylacetate-CoA ligase